jgi:hypothetical protein
MLDQQAQQLAAAIVIDNPADWPGQLYPPAQGPSGFCLVWLYSYGGRELVAGSKLWDRTTPKATF